MDEMIYDTRMHNARNGTGFILALFGLYRDHGYVHGGDDHPRPANTGG